MNLGKSLLVILLASLGSCAPTKTEKYGIKYKKMIWACYDTTSELTYDYVASNYYSEMVDYPPSAGTFLNCLANELGSMTKDFNSSIARAQNYANLYGEYNYTIDDLFDIYINATEYIVDIDLEAVNLTDTVFYSPVNITFSDVEVSYSFYSKLYYNFDESSTLAGIMYFYFIFVFILYGASNIIKRLGYQKHFNNRLIRWYRSSVSVPALFNGKHTEAPTYLKVFSTLVPTRVESIVVFLFICLNILLMSVKLEFVPEMLDEPLVIQKFEFLADRTGILSFGLVPLLIIFAGRNNLLVYITGIPYSSFIFYHKWVARLMWIHALIHSVCWTGYGVYYHYLTVYELDGYWRWGIVATVAGGIIMLQAFHVFRNMAYETFLVLHIILVIVFILGCWYHCYELGYLEWLYTSFAVWGADRLLRLYKMFRFGFPKAEIQYVGLDTLKITVKHSSSFTPFPSAFGYVYFITASKFWQSHPFTIIRSSTADNESHVFIKVKKGITSSLKKRLEALGDGKLELRICIEGPYGHRAPVEKYDTALLLAGGNGIPGPISYAIDLASRELRSKQHIKLVWVVRTAEYLSWFTKELSALVNSGVNIDIYITSNEAKVSEPSIEKIDDIQSSTEESKGDLKSDIVSVAELSSLIKLHNGRPNLNDLILEEVTSKDNGTIGIVSCGPPPMVDSIRAAVARNLTKSEHRVDLFEELQVW
ncbi:hypothetical protein WICMUC_001417 [Wickerhamomyces mucosus]|uniref:FAD-binding FR-type domain-containing protein n=1 Tax=Wickerhamomyces mucosus TaxID=1378264 RepID=A0A9P8PVJ2_9ASCO|nr:hypothetical protein WICMUC_001417 [Wickerhamomyces mucosus]